MILLVCTIQLEQLKKDCMRERCEYPIKDCSRDIYCPRVIRDCMGVLRETKSNSKMEECLAENNNSLRMWQCHRNKCPHEELSLFL